MINSVRLDEQNNQVKFTDMKNQAVRPEAGKNAETVKPETVQGEGITGNVDSAVYRALSDAGLPVNERNSAVVREMLENSMSIDKDTLMRLMTQSNIFKEADISTLILMNKNDIPVTHFTAGQLQAYINNEQNLTAQLGDAVDTLTDYLANEPGTGNVNVNMEVLEMLAQGNSPEEAILNMLSQGQAGTEAIYAAGGTAIVEALNGTQILNAQQTTSPENVIAQLGTDAEGSGANWMNGFGADEEGMSFNTTAEFSMQSDKESLAAENRQESALSSFLSETEIRELNSVTTKLFEGMNEMTSADTATEALKNIYENALGASDTQLEELFKLPVYQKLIEKALGDKFTLKPSDIKSSEEINEFYRETYSALEKLSGITDKEGKLSEKLTKPMDNIKFMDTLNDVLPYIQLPLTLSEGRTSGELYVFKNGRTKTDPSESHSVLLHLDMKSLGPTDVHMELKSGFLKLRFYCDSDDSKNLVEKYFGELEAALSAKNYNITSEFNVRTETMDNLVAALSDGGEKTADFKYNFDIRA